jgi:hypothetical protein
MFFVFVFVNDFDGFMGFFDVKGKMYSIYLFFFPVLIKFLVVKVVNL